MSELDTKTILSTIEIIRATKSLFVEHNPYLPVISALGGAFIGAIASFFPNYLLTKLKDRKEKRSTTLQMYAEVKAIIEISAHRNYIAQLEEVTQAFQDKRIETYTYQVQIAEDRFLVYKSCLDKLGVLDIDLQVKVVEFYQLLEAVTQDVKPGGLLNARPANQEAFQEALHISRKAKEIGTGILAIIEKRYQIPNS